MYICELKTHQISKYKYTTMVFVVHIISHTAYSVEEEHWLLWLTVVCWRYIYAWCFPIPTQKSFISFVLALSYHIFLPFWFFSMGHSRKYKCENVFWVNAFQSHLSKLFPLSYSSHATLCQLTPYSYRHIKQTCYHHQRVCTWKRQQYKLCVCEPSQPIAL